MDAIARARHYEKIAARYKELAKLAQLPYVSDLYLTYAARYARMAEQASLVGERSARIATRPPRAIAKLKGPRARRGS
jgi:hypothetical protein